MIKLSSSEVDFLISLICVNVLSSIIFSDLLETFSISFDKYSYFITFLSGSTCGLTSIFWL
ncbi:hypothetical protein V2P53_03290 [Mycoplasma capricolum subsp. capricolum]|uniref:hypothetical protein n=1 Tax=Mycoplasma capricolum TaxID=2095 RepID=UPI003DA54E66